MSSRAQNSSSPQGRNSSRIITVDFTDIDLDDSPLVDRLVSVAHLDAQELEIQGLIKHELVVSYSGIEDEQDVRDKLFAASDKLRLDVRHVDVQVTNPSAALDLVRGADVKPTTPRSFVHPYIFHGSLHLLVGDPGVAKSLIILWMLARASRGKKIFGCPIPNALDVMMLSNEDSPEVSMARYLKFGGDAQRITLEKFDGKTFALVDMGRLEATVKKYKPKILVIDSLMSHVGGDKDVYRGNVMSAMLAPLEALAERHGIIVFALMHMNKQDAAKVIYRVGGSIAIVGSARSVLVVIEKPDDLTRRVVGHIKSNYAKRGDAFEMSVLGHEDGLAAISYVGPSDAKIEELFQKPDEKQGGKKVREAQEFLESQLLEGAQPANEMYDAALEIGISDTSLERAKKKLQIKSVRSLDNAKYLWATAEQAKQIERKREQAKNEI